MDATPGRLAMTLGVPPSHLSRHLQVLVWAGLISLSRKGRSSVVTIIKNDSYIYALYSAVLSMPDDTGTFEGDLQRFISLTNSDEMPKDGQAKA